MPIQTLIPVEDSPLSLSDIQGDVLIGLQKDAEIFFFFAIADVALFKNVLPTLSGYVTSCELAAARELAIDALRAARYEAGEHVPRQDFRGLNIGFTFSGLSTLLSGEAHAADFDDAFKAGAHMRGGELADDVSTWKDAFKDDRIHGVLLVTGPGDAEVQQHLALALSLLGASVTEVYQEAGQTRKGAQRGHEHFGFRDGVSQPGIKGLSAPGANDPEQGFPGQDLIAAGEFVFGYADQFGDVGVPQAWMRDGSYMVFRRLEQKVGTFRRVTRESATHHGMDKGLLQARMVGRWPSGAPLITYPLQDNPAVGADPMVNNDFEFGEDQDQRRCPFAAHIRKTYPRDDLDPEATETQPHRIRRSGIPFGEDAEEGEQEKGSRGLMFVCYQTSITDQFEFVQKRWANDVTFVKDKRLPGGAAEIEPGHDPIIGQVPGNATRHMDEIVPNYPAGNTRSKLEMPEPFVISTAGAYFFMPSISALRASPLA